jgi:hypothetical protein
MEKKRDELKRAAEMKAWEKDNQPKRAMAPRKDTWEVEGIKGSKEVGGKAFYLVKFEGWAKPQWEPADNVGVRV